MFSPFERMVARRYLRSRRRESFISVIAWFSFLGIVLGVATLIIVMSVMNGFRNELVGRFLGLNGHLRVTGMTGSALPDSERLISQIRGTSGVVAADPLVEGQVLLTAGPNARGGLVRGMAPEDLRRHPMIADNIVSGSLDSFEGLDAAVLGARLAEALGVGVGDRVTLVSPQGVATAFGSVPRQVSYRVVALFQVGMIEYDSGFVYLPLEAAQIFYRLGNSVSGIEIRVDDPDRARAIGQSIADGLPPETLVTDWKQINASLVSALEVERNVMFLILSMIILVAAFNIVSGMTMLVKDKTADIAILRTMGATSGMVQRIFFMSGAAIGTFGTLIGVAIGLVFCWNIETIRQAIQTLLGTELFPAEIYFLSQLPADVDPSEVIAIVAMALGLTFLATIYPAWRAARVDPIEALRYE